jgi:5-methylcytosine-specific restriction endonuclease McrA
MKANHERWRLAHPEKHRANVAARKATKLAQRCICCADEDIQKVYDIAILCGDGAHVDHKTPLRLGGHHCAKNLQPMLAHEHIEKTKLDNRAIADAKRRSRLLQNWRIAA